MLRTMLAETTPVNKHVVSAGLLLTATKTTFGRGGYSGALLYGPSLSNKKPLRFILLLLLLSLSLFFVVVVVLVLVLMLVLVLAMISR